ncbi:hypothetical protein GCM10017691_47850 [Pseudonocardia petroleophila]
MVTISDVMGGLVPPVCPRYTPVLIISRADVNWATFRRSVADIGKGTFMLPRPESHRANTYLRADEHSHDRSLAIGGECSPE